MAADTDTKLEPQQHSYSWSHSRYKDTDIVRSIDVDGWMNECLAFGLGLGPGLWFWGFWFQFGSYIKKL